MKSLVLFLSFGLIFFIGCARNKNNINQINQIVEASCGQCNFNLKTKKGCVLAIKINGKAYFVDGTGIDDYGDAHAQEGFCNSVRKAKVSGKILNNTFIASSFKLIEKE